MVSIIATRQESRLLLKDKRIAIFCIMGLYKQYLRLGRAARNRVLGTSNNFDGPLTLQMLVSQQGKISNCKLAVIVVGLFALVMGIVLSTIPWVDYLIFQHLRLSNGSLSFYYWQKPGVVRLTKVYIFNVTNPENFLNEGEKPKLQEVGPFVYREDMEKVNIEFHDNGTVSYQHKKILQFVPELSVDKNKKITVPNIPLLTLSTKSNSLGFIVQKGISFVLSLGNFQPFVNVTAEELVFGYEDSLVALAHEIYRKNKRPSTKMGLLIARNGTLSEKHTIYTGKNGMENFGLLDKLNGLDHLPYWPNAPCSSIKASEGSFFPPRDVTKSDIVHIYDKDMCRIIPLQYRGPIEKQGITADLYTPPENIFETVDKKPDNKCYCLDEFPCALKGLQNISPCQYDAPVFLSFPHFYKADPSLLKPFEGLNPEKEKHETYFKIQPKLGVPVEGKVRVQLNLMVEQAENIQQVSKFPNIVYPIMWLEEGIDELTPSIRRWVYLATTVSDVVCPLFTYGSIFFGSCILVGILVNTYKSLLFTKETIEGGMRSLRNQAIHLTPSHSNIIVTRDRYVLLEDHSIERGFEV